MEHGMHQVHYRQEPPQNIGLAIADLQGRTTTIGPFEGGLALEMMLRRSTRNKLYVPTGSQLMNLLAALEY